MSNKGDRAWRLFIPQGATNHLGVETGMFLDLLKNNKNMRLITPAVAFEQVGEG